MPGPGSGWQRCSHCGEPIERSDDGLYFHVHPEHAEDCGVTRTDDEVHPEEGEPA